MKNKSSKIKSSSSKKATDNKAQTKIEGWKNLFSLAIIINIILVLFIFSIITFLPPVIPLLYGMPYGEEQLVDKYILLFTPVFGIVVSGVNYLLSRTTSELIIKRILEVMSLIITFLVGFTVIKIIFMVGFF